MKKLFNYSKSVKQRGFTLIEVIVVVAILAALTASAIYALAPGDKISSAEETGLKQILVSRIPTDLIQYRLKNGDISGFKVSDNSLAFMRTWPGVKNNNRLKFTPIAQKLTLEMETTFDASNLRNTLNAMQNVVANISSSKVLKIEYTVQ